MTDVNRDEVLYDENPSMFRNKPFLFILYVLLIPVFGIGILFLLVWYVQSKATRLIIREDELTFETGILNKSRVDIKTNRVRTVRIDQSLLQRMTNAGTVTVYTAGDNPEFSVGGLPDPFTPRDVIRSRSGNADA